MTSHLLPYFGQINIEKLEESYATEVSLNGNTIRVGMNFENIEISPLKIEEIKSFLEQIEKFDSQNKIYLATDFNDTDSSTVHEYIEFHLEELGQDELSGLVDFNNKTVSVEQQLLSRLQLERVGLYPDGKYGTDYFAVFDYTFEGNVYVDGRRTLTDQLIAVKTDQSGIVDHLSWES